MRADKSQAQIYRNTYSLSDSGVAMAEQVSKSVKVIGTTIKVKQAPKPPQGVINIQKPCVRIPNENVAEPVKKAPGTCPPIS